MCKCKRMRVSSVPRCLGACLSRSGDSGSCSYHLQGRVIELAPNIRLPLLSARIGIKKAVGGAITEDAHPVEVREGIIQSCVAMHQDTIAAAASDEQSDRWSEVQSDAHEPADRSRTATAVGVLWDFIAKRDGRSVAAQLGQSGQPSLPLPAPELRPLPMTVACNL